MARYFVPCTGKKPKATTINGHRLLILAEDREAFEQQLNLLGADTIKQVSINGSKAEERAKLTRLARSARAGLVIAPSEFNIGDVIRNLEAELPWIQ